MGPAPHGRHGLLDDEVAWALRPRAKAAGLHPSGPLNIGRPDDYRVPDRAYLRSRQTAVYNPTAAIVVELVSPGDETRRKLAFYYRAGVEELLIIDPEARTVEWLTPGHDGFVPAPGSTLLGLSAADLHAELTWPD